jgi:hypothetical protein
MSNSNQITVKTNVRRSRADALPANETLLHCLATSDGDGTYLRDEPFTITSKEQQAVHNTALTNHFQWAAQRDEIYSRPSKDSMVLQNNRGRDDSHEDIIVALYDGPKQGLDALNDMGYGEVICSKKSPDSDTSAASDTDKQLLPPLETYSSFKFKRSWLSTSQENSSTHCRWFKVLHVKDAPADTNWSQILATLYQNIDTTATKADWVNKVRLCHLPVKISHKIIYMQQLEQCGNNTVRDFEISTSTGVPLRSIKQLAGLNKSSFPASLHDIQDEDSFLGADLVSGTQRSFRTDKHDNLYVVEKPRTALVFRDQPCTLADLVVQRHQSQVTLLQSRDGIAMLNKEFRQVKVSVRVGKQTENRTIAGFREGKAADAPLMLRHYAWSLKGEAFGLSDLPSVNVGTHDKPLLLPLELCTVLPSQRLRGPIDASLSRMVENRRPNIISQFLTYFKATGLVVVPSPLPNNDDTLHEKIARACGRGFPNILFVEANSLRVESRNWVALQDSVQELIKTSLEEHSGYQQPTIVPTDQKPLLRLRYDSDAGLSEKWTEQLRQFTTLHSGSEGQQTFAILYLPAESRHAEMYKIIKKACDITVGVQTFFVNHASLESRVCELSTAGVLKAAAKLCSRICLRIPRTSLATTSKKGTPQAKRFVIAMHVSPVTFPSKSRIASGHVTKLYLVALVMSELETGSYLRTEVKLYNANQVKNLDMATIFAPFARSLPATGKRYLTILRSGHPPGAEHVRCAVKCNHRYWHSC